MVKFQKSLSLSLSLSLFLSLSLNGKISKILKIFGLRKNDKRHIISS